MCMTVLFSSGFKNRLIQLNIRQCFPKAKKKCIKGEKRVPTKSKGKKKQYFFCYLNYIFVRISGARLSRIDNYAICLISNT